jgi:hypothetical protein
MNWHSVRTKVWSAIVAAFAGAIISTIGTSLILYALFAARGYTSEALVEMPLWSLPAIAGTGALLAVVAVLLFGDMMLSPRVRAVAFGCLAGVFCVVLPTIGIANARGGPYSKWQAPYLHQGLVYGVPCGLLIGGMAGWFVSKRSKIVQQDVSSQ